MEPVHGFTDLAVFMATLTTASTRTTGITGRFRNEELSHLCTFTPMKHGTGRDMLATRATTVAANVPRDSQAAATRVVTDRSFLSQLICFADERPFLTRAEWLVCALKVHFGNR